jgi:hypothetical protein
MAQRLEPIRLAPVVQLRTPSGRSGYNQGMKLQYRGYMALPDVVDEETAVDIVRNLCDLATDGELTESLLRQDTMRLIAWTLAVAK